MYCIILSLNGKHREISYRDSRGTSNGLEDSVARWTGVRARMRVCARMPSLGRYGVYGRGDTVIVIPCGR